MSAPCAGSNTIAALVAGAIDDRARDELERHLDACEACRQLVADLGRGLGAMTRGAHAGEPTEALPRIGGLLGRYEIRRLLGVGGMGVVYEAHDTALDRRVALKLVRPDIVVDGGEQLRAEAQAMARLRHPNIAMVHDVGVEGGRLFLSMEYIAGSTLRDWLAREPRAWRAIVDVFVAAGRGLAYVHRVGLVHLDFKPDNVLVGADDRPVVTDFGLARIVAGETEHGGGIVAGTPAYMAPEQRRGEPTDARADQFAFAASLLEALGGRRMREGITMPGPRWLRRVLTRALSERSRDRYPSMDALVAALIAGAEAPTLPRRAVMVTLAATFVAIPLVFTRTVDHFIERPSIVESVAPALGADASRDGTALGNAETDTPETSGSEASFDGAPRTHRQGSVGLPGARAHNEDRTARFESHDARGRSFEAIADIGGIDNEDGSPSGSAASSPWISPRGCDDGSPRICTMPRPECPPATVASMQRGCWTCADALTCEGLGIPRSCSDGTPLTCSTPPPACDGHEIPSIRAGCWVCDDPLTCRAHTQLPPLPPKPAPERTCGDGVCRDGETHATCADDCCELDAQGNCATTCGNGFCTPGEDHASCPSDCCETTSTGVCVASCGNGFCEEGEDHTSCPGDCCVTGPTGACAAVCGNGFCESGEDHTSCAGDCCETTSTGACAAVCGNGFCEEGEDASECAQDCG